jgi:hypothetical protein
MFLAVNRRYTLTLFVTPDGNGLLGLQIILVPIVKDDTGVS